MDAGRMNMDELLAWIYHDPSKINLKESTRSYNLPQDFGFPWIFIEIHSSYNFLALSPQYLNNLPRFK